VDEWFRRNGFTLLLVFGVAVTIVGLVQENVGIVVTGAIVAVVGGMAPLSGELRLPFDSGLKWRDAYRPTVDEMQRRTHEGSRSSGDVVVTPEPARLRLKTFPPTVTVEPLPPEKVEHIRTVEDFADAVADSIRIVDWGSIVQAPPAVHGEGTVENPDGE
jgi:hypothetical protein